MRYTLIKARVTVVALDLLKIEFNIIILIIYDIISTAQNTASLPQSP